MLFFKRDSSSFPSCVCRNHLNESVDWFIIYKLPRLIHSIDPLIVNGTGYMYLDSSSSLDQWHFSSVSITSIQSLTGLTLSPLYQSNDYSHLFYNDQPPNQSDSLVHGHSKGVLAFDDLSGKGFWLIHSVPHFPLPIEQGYFYPDSGNQRFFLSIIFDVCYTGRIFGQTMLCLTINTTSHLPFNQIDSLTNHFLYTYPLIYASNFTTFATKRYPILSNDIIRNKSHVNSAPYIRVSPFNISNLEMLTFAKYGLANIDMSSELIVPILRQTMLSETWSNGGQTNLPSNCTGIYHTENIQQLAFNFTVHYDHSKWLVSDNNGYWTCIGDMNRQMEQKQRHGGFACINNEQIQQRFRQLVLSIESCPHRELNFTFHSTVQYILRFNSILSQQ